MKDDKNKNKKPPLGITPRHIYNIERMETLVKCITRYLDAEMAPNSEWYDELGEILLERKRHG